MTLHPTTKDAPPAGHAPPAGPLHRWILPMRPPKPVNPALLKHAAQREELAQNRIADAITAFAGSMALVLISQNRADTKRQVLADQQWRTVQEEDDQNKQL